MNRWLIEVSADIPYPWSKHYSIERSSAGAAASEAIKKFRVDVREKCMKAKKLDRIRLAIERAADCGSEESEN